MHEIKDINQVGLSEDVRARPRLQPGEFEVRGLRMWKRSFRFPDDALMSETDLRRVNEFRKPACDLEDLQFFVRLVTGPCVVMYRHICISPSTRGLATCVFTTCTDAFGHVCPHVMYTSLLATRLSRSVPLSLNIYIYKCIHMLICVYTLFSFLHMIYMSHVSPSLFCCSLPISLSLSLSLFLQPHFMKAPPRKALFELQRSKPHHLAGRWIDRNSGQLRKYFIVARQEMALPRISKRHGLGMLVGCLFMSIYIQAYRCVHVIQMCGN